MVISSSKENAPEPIEEIEDVTAPDIEDQGEDFVPTGAGWEPAEIEVGESEGRVQRLHLSPPEGADEDSDDPPEKAPIGKAEFRSLFLGSFSAPKVMIGPQWEPFDIQPGEQDAAVTTSDLIYDWLAKMGWLPREGMLGVEAFIAITFVMGKLRIAGAIVAQDRAAKAAPRQDQEAHGGDPDGTPGGLAWMEPEGGVQ